MTRPARNFKKNPHTAHFLMTFHTAGGTATATRDEDTYEVPEHTGGGDGMIEVNTGRVEPRNAAPRDARSEGQVRYMDNLISWIAEKDQAAGDAARVWTDNVTTAGKWSYDKADKFSISAWIDRLKAKNAALNEAAKAAPVAAPAADDFADVPDGYYAVADPADGVIKFYRFRTAGPNSSYTGTRFLKVQASDEFHSIRSRATRTAILTAIRNAGPADAMAAYGQHIGSCGRCNRTLTDALSRSRGIGPDCWEKM